MVMSEYTSSPESQGGNTPSNWLVGRQLSLFGPEAAHASPSPQQARVTVGPTNATSGPRCSGSSASAALSMSLGSRLQTLLGTDGLMEYRQTWKRKATPAGRLYWEHTASGRRTSASGSTGEPSGLTGWPTPNAGPQNDGDTTWQERRKMLKEKHGNGNGFGLTLGQAVTLAGWPTPQAFDATSDGQGRALRYKGNAPSEAGNTRNPETPGSYRGDLKDYALLATGPAPEPSSAPTASTAGYRLNPRFSLYLMAIPDEYMSLRPLATRSWRRSPPSS